jgi:hypothetical protein
MATKKKKDSCGYAEVPWTWSGSPAPECPDEWWIDDLTGEYIDAVSGERTTRRIAVRKIKSKSHISC